MQKKTEEYLIKNRDNFIGLAETLRDAHSSDHCNDSKRLLAKLASVFCEKMRLSNTDRADHVVEIVNILYSATYEEVDVRLAALFRFIERSVNKIPSAPSMLKIISRDKCSGSRLKKACLSFIGEARQHLRNTANGPATTQIEALDEFLDEKINYLELHISSNKGQHKA